MHPQQRIKKLRAERDEARAKLSAIQDIDAPDDDLIRIVVKVSQGGKGGQSGHVLRAEDLGDNPAVGLAEAIKAVAYDAAMGFAKRGLS